MPEPSLSLPNREVPNKSNHNSSESDNNGTPSPKERVATQGVPALLPNPWIDNPDPKSNSNSGIVYRLKSFPNLVRAMHEGSSEWPYRLYPPKNDRILFYEFRGFGRPSDDFGWPGDFYLDLTPFPRYFLYVRHANYWYCNNWDPDPTRLEFPLHRHPLLRDRYLWATKGWGFMWLTGQTIRAEGRSSVRRERDHEPMVLKALKYDDKEPLPVKFNDDAVAREFTEKELRADALAVWLEEQEIEEIATARRLIREKRKLKMEHYDLEYQRKHDGREENPRSYSFRRRPRGESISSDDSMVETGQTVIRTLPAQAVQEDTSQFPVPARWRKPSNSPGVDKNRLDMDHQNHALADSQADNIPIPPSLPASAIPTSNSPPNISKPSTNQSRTRVSTRRSNIQGKKFRRTHDKHLM
ncbi:hypothetical protein BDZ94DRAFT_1313810 [Collybia nuda]|uniref:Uncharacterized protein n=1 Tax=Collybia nuda TaxID=64659 RepID=A0A9P6CEB6_9AGAR|nr:hypothetical protein BDZ94DRAFT_1313810 [Collybia nuda]